MHLESRKWDSVPKHLSKNPNQGHYRACPRNPSVPLTRTQRAGPDPDPTGKGRGGGRRKGEEVRNPFRLANPGANLP